MKWFKDLRTGRKIQKETKDFNECKTKKTRTASFNGDDRKARTLER